MPPARLIYLWRPFTDMSELRKAKVLVVDDNVVLTTLLMDMLNGKYEASMAQSGAVALEMIAESPPDLILLDIHMPGLSGFQVCTRLKGAEATREIPIIFLTADNESTAKIKGLELGAIDYITKPFNRHEVLVRVHNQLELQRTHELLRAANMDLRRHQELLDADLLAGAEIQKALLPSDLSDLSPLNFAWFFQPCERIGGDIFNVIKIDDQHIGVYIIDVCGHGVPAAMIATLVFQYLSPSCCIARSDSIIPSSCCCLSPAEVIRKIDREFPFERFNRYFTMAYMTVDCRSGEYAYCCAGHPPIIKLNGSGQVELLGEGGTFIGVGDLVPQLEEGHGQLLLGERLYFHTDGIVEHENKMGELFGMERLLGAIQASGGKPLPSAVDGVIKEVWQFADSATLRDDFSLLGLEFIPD